MCSLHDSIDLLKSIYNKRLHEQISTLKAMYEIPVLIIEEESPPVGNVYRATENV